MDMFILLIGLSYFLLIFTAFYLSLEWVKTYSSIFMKSLGLTFGFLALLAYVYLILQPAFIGVIPFEIEKGILLAGILSHTALFFNDLITPNPKLIKKV